MKRMILIAAALMFVLDTGVHSAPRKVGFVMNVSPAGSAFILSSGKRSKLKPYKELFAGDIIEVNKSGRVEIFLNNLKKHTIMSRVRVKILDDYSIVNASTGNHVACVSKRNRFSEDLARDSGRSGTTGMGASRGGMGASKGINEKLAVKVRSEIKEADKIEDEYLRHTARYYIFWKYSYKEYMKKEGEHLAKLEAEGKGGDR